MNENQSKRYFSNPFDQNKCQRCGHWHDAWKSKCPKCGEPSQDERANPIHDITFANPFIEAVLFVVGFTCLNLIARIISKIIIGLGLPSVMTEIECNMLLNYGTYTVLFLILAGICSIYIPKLLKSFTKPEMLWGAMVAICVLGFDIVWGMISRSLGATINENQTAVDSITKPNLLLAIIFICLIGPMCEELTYRVGLFNFTRRINRVIGYLAVSVIFGLIHIHDYGSVNEWLSYPSYVFAGLAFAFAYEKWGLGASFLAHFLVNFVATMANA